MRARVAYIFSLGTTAILVAAALLMLAVVGAIVAFRGWPGGEAGAGVQSVPLAPPAASARVALVRHVTPTPSVVRTLTVAAVPAATKGLSTAGLVKQASAGVVPGLVLVPADGSPMRGEGPQPAGTNGPAGAPGGPVPGPGAGGPLPPGGDGGVNPAASLPAPPAGPNGAPPSADQLTSAIGQLIAQTPPPPGFGHLTGAVAGIR
jgi:hypothetical protein